MLSYYGFGFLSMAYILNRRIKATHLSARFSRKTNNDHFASYQSGSRYRINHKDSRCLAVRIIRIFAHLDHIVEN
jgi:hypothetical protein